MVVLLMSVVVALVLLISVVVSAVSVDIFGCFVSCRCCQCNLPCYCCSCRLCVIGALQFLIAVLMFFNVFVLFKLVLASALSLPLVVVVASL